MRKTILLSCSLVVVVCAQTALAHTERFRVFEMTGANENPINASLGTGTALITFDNDLFTMRVQTSFEGLTGTTTMAHIHCCTPAPGNVGVATQLPSFVGFPLGVTSGTYDNTFDMTLASSWNPAFVTAQGSISNAYEVLLQAARDGNRTYLNIHTSFRSGGEIRGHLQPVPEPATCMLALVGVAGVLMRRRGR